MNKKFLSSICAIALVFTIGSTSMTAFASTNYADMTEPQKQVVTENTLQNLEAQKTSLKVKLDAGLITQAQYDSFLSSIDLRISEIKANGLTASLGVSSSEKPSISSLTDDQKKALADNAIAKMELRKTQMKSLLDSGIITQAEYDYAISKTNLSIEFIKTNGIPTGYGMRGMGFGRGMGIGGEHGTGMRGY